MCKTCENVNTMFLCVECFLNGCHDGHDYYLIRCEDGATCGKQRLTFLLIDCPNFNFLI